LKKIEKENFNGDWFVCFKFEGRCSLDNLLEVLNIFREWAESCKKED